jgi:hypothetical protein
LARLLEVVAEDLLVLPGSVRRPRFDPVGQALVELGAEGLGHSLVGDVADHDMGEPERLLVDRIRSGRTDKLLACERPQVTTHQGPQLLRTQRRHRRPPELPPNHGGTLRYSALLVLQPIEPSGE